MFIFDEENCFAVEFRLYWKKWNKRSTRMKSIHLKLGCHHVQAINSCLLSLSLMHILVVVQSVWYNIDWLYYFTIIRMLLRIEGYNFLVLQLRRNLDSIVYIRIVIPYLHIAALFALFFSFILRCMWSSSIMLKNFFHCSFVCYPFICNSWIFLTPEYIWPWFIWSI